MPVVQILDKKKYAKAIGLLIKAGGIFWSKPIQRFVIGPAQRQMLEDAGLLPKTTGAKKGGAKKK